MENVLLLGKIDTRRLMKKLEHKNDCHAHECKHCGMLMNFQWKVKGSHKNKVGGGGGSYHTVHATRHLESYCDEAGCNSIKERLLEKSAKWIKHEEDVAVKAKHFQEELVESSAQTERERGSMKKLPSKLSYQDKCFSSMAFLHFFIIISYI